MAIVIGIAWLLCAGGVPTSTSADEPGPGHGSFRLRDTVYSFSAVRCELGEDPDPSGYVYELYALARGRERGRPFFIELERGRRNAQRQATIRFYWAELPNGWRHGGLRPAGDNIERLDSIRKANGFESMSRWGLLPDQLVAEGQRIRTVGPVRFLRLRRGTADADAGVGEVSLTCSP
jgi:hypothetical protein